jgi:hypothetical protein
LNPKKPKDLIDPTCAVTDSSEDLVEAITSFYWTEVRATLVEMKASNIHIEGLGIFGVKRSKLPMFHEKYTKMLKKYETLKEENRMTFQRFAIMRDLEVRLAKIEKLRGFVEKEDLRKLEARKKREEYNQNIKKLSSDNGGSL